MVKLMRLLPSTRRIGVWLRTHQIVSSHQTRFRVLVTALKGDDETLTQTRHLEAALHEQLGVDVLPLDESVNIADGELDEDALHLCRSLIGTHNGDSLLFGEVMPAAPRLRIRLVGRYEGDAGRHGPYQMDWNEFPKHFGPDVEGHLLALVALSVAPAAQGEADRAFLINLLRPAATKLTRLLESPNVNLDSERQGACWHALGLAASLLGEHADSQRWLEVAVHAHKTALLIWQKDTVVFQWAIVQNNLGHALRLLAERQADRDRQLQLLKDSTDAFGEALRVYRAAAAAETYRRQTETNLANAEALQAACLVAAE